YGRVSLRGVIPASWSRDHVGPMTLCAEDAGTLLTAIAGPDPEDVTHCRRPTEDFGRLIGQEFRGLRIGRSKSWFFEDVEPAVLEPVESAIAELGGVGCRVEEVDIPIAAAGLDINLAMLGAETAAYHGRRLFDRSAPYHDFFRWRHVAASLLPAE